MTPEQVRPYQEGFRYLLDAGRTREQSFGLVEFTALRMCRRRSLQLGARSGDVATIRALWAIQDRLALTPGEEKAIELRRELVAGRQRFVWNPK